MVICDLHRIYMLPAGGSCLLGSINLSAFVDENGNFNFEEFESTVDIATRALNDVLDEGLPLHPLQEQRDSVRDWRQIGCGIMGLADMLIKMGITYGSQEAIDLCDKIAKCLLNTSVLTSAMLAKENGTFPNYDYPSMYNSLFYKLNISDAVKAKVQDYGMRNSQLLTIAPTGTLSTMLGISGGIEPIFANYYTRKTESLHGEDRYYKVYTPIVEEYIKAHNLKDDTELPDFFVTSADIKPINRIKMQGIWQKYIDASISSTVNLPEEATVEDVMGIYLEAYRHGLKGITVFRSGCRRSAILSTDSKKEDKQVNNASLPRGFILDSSDNLIGKKRKLMTGCGSLHCTAFFDPETGDLMETYLSKGSTGGCNNFMIGLSRMISLAARSGCTIDSIIDQLNSSGACPSYAVRHATKHDTSKGSCCPVAIGNALKEMWEEMQDEISDNTNEQEQDTVEDNVATLVVDKEHCPECGNILIHEGGCDICKDCGWSKCN